MDGGISKELASLLYIYLSVDDVANGILQQGRGGLMAKMDIQDAYRKIPVHSTDQLLLRMHWKRVSFFS